MSTEKTLKSNESFIEETNNIRLSPEARNRKFFENEHLRLLPVTENGIFLKKFLDAYDIGLDDPEQALSQAEEILKKVSKDIRQLRYSKARFLILYLLREMKCYSFEQLSMKINVNKKILSEIVKDLRERGFIKETPMYNKDIKYLNNVLKFSGDVKKRKFYELNYSNGFISKKFSEIDRFVDESIKKEVREEQENLREAKLEYEEHLEMEARRKKRREYARKTKLEKIREALSPQVGKKFTPQQLKRYLHFGCGLISLKSWKGNRSAYAVYDGGWEDYLKSLGMIKEMNIDEKMYLLVTKKVRLTKK